MASIERTHSRPVPIALRRPETCQHCPAVDCSPPPCEVKKADLGFNREETAKACAGVCPPHQHGCELWRARCAAPASWALQGPWWASFSLVSVE